MPQNVNINEHTDSNTKTHNNKGKNKIIDINKQ